MKGPLPTDYVRLPVRGGYLVASSALAGWAEEQVQLHGSLEASARQTPGCREIFGRGAAYVIDLPNGQKGMVRRLRHGGMLAFATADRFLRWGLPRPLNELQVSLHLKQYGIASPPVLAACVYPRSWYYHGELLRAYLEEGTDLASYLFESDVSEAQRQEALERATHLASRMAESGVCHTDYNARNLLVQRQGNALRLLVIDLEKSKPCTPGSERAAQRMRRRLGQSLDKLALRYGRTLPALAYE